MLGLSLSSLSDNGSSFVIVGLGLCALSFNFFFSLKGSFARLWITSVDRFGFDLLFYHLLSETTRLAVYLSDKCVFFRASKGEKN